MVCPVLWCSKIKTEIGLIATDEEYIALSQDVHDKLHSSKFLNMSYLSSILIFQMQKYFVRSFNII